MMRTLQRSKYQFCNLWFDPTGARPELPHSKQARYLQYYSTDTVLIDRLEFECWCLTPLSAISLRPVLVVEEAEVPGENHRPWASNW